MSTPMTPRFNAAAQRNRLLLAAETNAWQVNEIRSALKEADAGDFADHGEVQALTRKWKAPRTR